MASDAIPGAREILAVRNDGGIYFRGRLRLRPHADYRGANQSENGKDSRRGRKSKPHFHGQPHCGWLPQAKGKP
jgi:hypothetical protein